MSPDVTLRPRSRGGASAIGLGRHGETDAFQSIDALTALPDGPARAGADLMSDPPAPGAFWRNRHGPQPFDLSAVLEVPRPGGSVPQTEPEGPADRGPLPSIAALMDVPPQPPVQPSAERLDSATPPLLRMPAEVVRMISEHLPFDMVLRLRQTHSRLRHLVGQHGYIAALTTAWISQMKTLSDPFEVVGFMKRATPHLKDGWSAETGPDKAPSGLAALMPKTNAQFAQYTQSTQALTAWMHRLASTVAMDTGAAKSALIHESRELISRQPWDQQPHLMVELMLRMMVVDRRRALENAWQPGEAPGWKRFEALVDSHPDAEAKKWLHAFNKLCALELSTFNEALDHWVGLSEKQSPNDGRSFHLLQCVPRMLVQVWLDPNSPERLALPLPLVTPTLDALHRISQHVDVETLARYWQPETWMLLSALSPDRLHHLDNFRQAARRLNTPEAVELLVLLTLGMTTEHGNETERAGQVHETLQDVRSIDDPAARHALWNLCIDRELHQLKVGPHGTFDPAVGAAIFEGYMSGEPPVERVALYPEPTQQQLTSLVLSFAPPVDRMNSLKRVFDRAPSEWLAAPRALMALLPVGEQLTVLEWVQAEIAGAPLTEPRLRRLISTTSAAFENQATGSSRCFERVATSLELLERDPALLTPRLSNDLLRHAGTWAEHLTGPTPQESEEMALRASHLFNAALSRLAPGDADVSKRASLCFDVASTAPKQNRAASMVAPWMLIDKPEMRQIMALLDELETDAGQPRTLAALQRVLSLIAYDSDFWLSGQTAGDQGTWFEAFTKTLACPGWKVAPDEAARLAFLTTAAKDMAAWAIDAPDLDLQPQEQTLLGEISRLCACEDTAVRADAQALHDDWRRMQGAGDDPESTPEAADDGEAPAAAGHQVGLE